MVMDAHSSGSVWRTALARALRTMVKPRLATAWTSSQILAAAVIWSGCGRVLKVSEEGDGVPGLGQALSCQGLNVLQ